MKFPAFACVLLFVVVVDSEVAVVVEADGPFDWFFDNCSHLSIYDFVISDGSSR